MTRRLRQLARSPVAHDLVAVLGAWIVLTALVNPVGNFPLDDDWSYGRSVEILLDHGRLDLVFAAVPLVAQVVWGALFGLPFGFSFTALRVSGWVLGAVGLVATYGLLNGLNPPRRLALVGTLLLAVNPLYIVLALTFMTDVPSLALSVGSLALFAHGTATGSARTLAAGVGLLVLALLVRQPAVAVAVGFCVAWLATRRLDPRNVLVALAVPAIALVVLVGYEAVIRRTIGIPPLYNQPYDPLTAAGAMDVPGALAVLGGRLATELIYLGLFSLPLSVVVAGMHWRRASAALRRWTAAAGVAVAVLAVALLSGRTVAPYGNVAYDLGLGPPLLRDAYLLGLAHLPTAPQPVWSGAALLGLVGLVLLVWLGIVALSDASAAGRRPGPGRPVLLASTVTAAAYLGFLAVAGFLDRYLLWLVPPVIAVVVGAAPVGAATGRRWLGAAAVLMTGFAVFGVAGGHDYFAWNRSRWEALRYLVEDLRVPPSRIDGGFEFNGWYGYDAAYRERPSVSWWWVQDDEYLVAFGPVEGFGEVARFPYQRWLPPGEGTIVVLRRLAAGSAQATERPSP